jgi:hypothetical protein
MTHRIVVDLATGTTTQVEYTAEEQAAYDAAVAAQAAEALAAQEAEALAAQAEVPAEVVETPDEPTETQEV